MNSKFKNILTGVLAISALCGVSATAKEAVETIIASYRNIQLVVDGTVVEPKDAEGAVVEPFIYNGTTYLPVRAVATAFDKDVIWDGATNTVSLGTQLEKPDKELTLWNRPYTECTYPNRTYSFEEKASGYIKWEAEEGENDQGYEQSENKWKHTNAVSYDLKGKAKTIKGEFYISGYDEGVEGTLKIYNSQNKSIYESPIMRSSTANVSFNADVTGQQSVRFVFEQTGKKWDSASFYIKDAVIVSSDY